MQRRFDFACLVAAFAFVASPCPAQMVGAADVARRKALEEADATERLPVDELKSRVPDLEITERTPAVVFAPMLFAFNVPYQYVGVGAALNVLPLPWLRFDALYSFGASSVRSKSQASHYAETSGGLRVLGVSQDVAVNFNPNGNRTLFRPRVTVIKGWLPARHALFVEGGAMTGLAFVAHCSGATCDELSDTQTADRQQLVMPFAGVRYALDYRADSNRLGMAQRLFLYLYAHVLAKPLEVRSADRFLTNGNSAGTPGWGGRAGVRVLATSGCVQDFFFGWRCLDAPGLGGALELGYAPYPRSVLARLALGYSIY